MSDVSFAIAVVVAIVLFSEFLLLIFWMLGWRALSQKSDPPNFDGNVIHHITADIGSVTYGYLLTISVSPRGLACRMPVILSLWHKPFFLPWKDLTGSQCGKSWFETVIILKFQIGKTKVRFRIPERHGEVVGALKAAIGEIGSGLKGDLNGR
jgi:hypothetical protein